MSKVKFVNWIFVFSIFSNLFLSSPAYSKNPESESSKNSPIFLYSGDYNGEYITYLLYKKKGGNHFLFSSYQLDKNLEKAVLYDVETRKVILEEEYSREVGAAIKIQQKIEESKLVDVSSLRTHYGKNYSRFYRIGHNKLYKGLGGRCSSPFDSYVRFSKGDSELGAKKSILLNRYTTHISDKNCNRMNGLPKVRVPVTSLGIEKVYQLSGDMYLLAFSEYPLMIFMDGNLDLYTDKYLNVVDFKKVKDIENNKKLIQGWLQQPENMRNSLFPNIASAVEKAFF